MFKLFNSLTAAKSQQNPEKSQIPTCSSCFTILCVMYVCLLQLSNLVAGKIISVAGGMVTAAEIIFPLTYILGDVFAEVYGFRRARFVIWLGFFCNFFAVLIYVATIALPAPDFWPHQEAFATVLHTTPRLFIASLAGYLFGEFSNAVILSKLKIFTSGKLLWLRTISSSIVGEAFDTVIFSVISFYGLMENRFLMILMISQYFFKLGYEILFTPVLYWCVHVLKKHEKIDVYDHGEKYHLF